MTRGTDDRAHLLDLVQRYGWDATAFQTLESGYRYFFCGLDACVAYVDTGSAWVSAGAPIAARANLKHVASEFIAAARNARRRACFFATEDHFASMCAGTLRSLAVGQQAEWNPHQWTTTLSQHRSLREQLRRARAKGVSVHVLNAHDLCDESRREAITQVSRGWLDTRRMAPMGFLVRVEPFSLPAHRLTFVADLDGSPIAFASVIPIPARRGHFIEHLIRDAHAPNGTSELLVDAVMRLAASEGSALVTLGLAPLAGDVALPLRVLRRAGKALYDFDGLRKFKAKLRPDAWKDISLAYPSAQGVIPSVVDSLSAFTDGGFLSFGWRTLVRKRDA